MMRDSVAFGRPQAPERMPWAAHVRWAVENDVLYILDLRRDAYLSLPMSTLQSDIAVLERRLETRGLFRTTREAPVAASGCQLGAGGGDIWSFWRAALWARSVMRRRDLDRATSLLQGADAGADARVQDLVARFQNWRPLYPRAALCLFDSLALGRFLLSAGIRSNLVYAVRGGPFAAHAWLETGGDIINDDPEYCAGFTPMRAP